MRLSVIFDMDGTLIDSEPMSAECWIKAIVHHGFDRKIMEPVAKSIIGMNGTEYRKTILNAYPKMTGKQYDEVLVTYNNYFKEMAKAGGIPLKEGAREVLSFLREKNAIIGLGTSSEKALAERELSELGLFHYFDGGYYGDMVKNGKPDPEIYLKCADELGVDITETYIIEDSYNGIRSAYDAGAKPILIPDLLPPTDEMQEKCVAILPSLLEVISYFN